jgi:hypothetical protein
MTKGGLCSPGNFRRFDLSDAIIIPGLFSLNNTPELGSGVILRNGDTKITLTDDEIDIDNGQANIKISGGTVDINNGNLTVD